MSTSLSTQSSAAIALRKMLGGYGKARLVFVAAKLGLADHIANGLQKVEVLAPVVQADPRALYRFLRALATVGLVEEVELQRFVLTPIGACLQTNTPDSLHALVQWAEEVEWEMWEYLEQCVRTGKSAFEHAYGLGMFDYFQLHPEKEALFNRAMTSYVSSNVAGIVSAYPVRPSLKIVDIGGGHGALMTALLRANPATYGVIFDLPSVVEATRQHIAMADLAARCECVGGDFFQEVYAGGDAYFLVSILHDWDDERCMTILQRCRQALHSAAKLLIVELVVPAGTGPAFAKAFDIAMLVLTSGGRERTEAEFRQLLHATGFELARVIPTTAPVCIIEALPV